MKNSRIVLKGQNYATPHTESVEIKSQGVLCGSGVAYNNYGNTTQHYLIKSL